MTISRKQAAKLPPVLRKFINKVPVPETGSVVTKTESETKIALNMSYMRVMTYNVLSMRMTKRERYPTNGIATRYELRLPMMFKEIKRNHPSVLFLQEIDSSKFPQWARFLNERKMTYKFAAYPGRSHGCLTAWSRMWNHVNTTTVVYDRTSDYTQSDYSKNVGLVTSLEKTVSPNISAVTSGNHYVVATTHLIWRNVLKYERLRQFVMLMEEVNRKSRPDSHIAVAGDLNCSPEEPLYRVFVERVTPGSLSWDTVYHELLESVKHPESNPTDDCSATVNLLLTRALNVRQKLPSLFSAYAQILGTEPSFTTWAETFRTTIDYILVSDGIQVNCVLETPTKEDMGAEPSSLPRFHEHGGWPSDHVSLVAEIYTREQPEPETKAVTNAIKKPEVNATQSKKQKSKNNKKQKQNEVRK